MTVFAPAGCWTLGRNVIETMGGKIVPSSQFTLFASVGVLFFVGLGLLVSKLFGVPASRSMTAVGAIAWLGVATECIIWPTMGRIVSWWPVAPVFAFWVCAVISRYLYPYLDAWFKLGRMSGPPLRLDWSGRVPRGGLAPEVPRIGEEEPAELAATDLFNPASTGRVIMLWVLTPTISALTSHLLFRFVRIM